jgi:hypothetical protein
MPLTYAGTVDAEEAVTERQQQARKIRPEYTRGELRRVAVARQQAEAEFIQLLLLEEGVPSTLRRSAGFDVPDFLAAGPRDVLVPESGVEVARALLVETEISPSPLEEGARSQQVSPLVLLAGVIVALGVVALLLWAVLGAS